MFIKDTISIGSRDDTTNRKRRASFFRFFFLAGITLAGGSAVCTHCKAPAHKEKKAPVPASAASSSLHTDPERPCQSTNQLSYSVKRGDAFAKIMKRFGVSPDRAEAFHRALRTEGLSALYPGDSLILTLDGDSSLVGISFYSRLQCRYHAVLRDSVIVAEKQPLRFTIRRCLMNGVLETSLLDAMLEYDLGPLLACKLSDIFAWDINFFLDPRKGDSFQVLFEQKYAAGKYAGYGDVIAARYECQGKIFFAIGFRGDDGALRYYDSSGRSVQKEFLKAPLRFSRISSTFSRHRKHPILGIVRPHLAIDYAAPRGTPVYASADGKIISAGWEGGYGKCVGIGHGGAFSTYYGHLASISKGIHAGAYVKQGQMIGTVGATGLASGPHLDYRMMKNGVPVNPLTVNLPSKSGIGASETAAFNRAKESCFALFYLRYQQRLGCHIIDINTSIDGGEIAAPQIYPDSTHGIESNS